MSGRWVRGSFGIGVFIVVACGSGDDDVSCGPGTVEQGGECVPADGMGGADSEAGAGGEPSSMGGSAGVDPGTPAGDGGVGVGGSAGTAATGGTDVGGAGASDAGGGGGDDGIVDPDPLGCSNRDVTHATVVEGILTKSATWSGVVHVPRDVVVRNEATITIAAGTKIIVGFGASIEFGPQSNRSALHSLGTAEAPVRFCGEAAVRGYWKQLALRGSVRASELRHTLIADAGSAGFPALSLEAPVLIDAVRVEKALNDGVHATDFAEGSRGLVVTEVGGAPLAVKAVAALDLPAEIALTGNGVDVIRVDFTTFAENLRFRNTGLPWRLGANLDSIGSDESVPSIDFEAGVVVEIPTNRTLHLGSGAVRALGEPDAPVVFRAPPCPQFGCSGMSRGSEASLVVGFGSEELTFEHVRLEGLGVFDGSFTTPFGALEMQRSGPIRMVDVEILNSLGWGARFSGGGTFSPESEDIVVEWPNPQFGSSRRGILFSSCEFLSSMPRSVRIGPDVFVEPLCDVSGTLRSFDGTYLFGAGILLSDTRELDIEPGAQLRINGLLIADGGSRLRAVGTAAAPITFSFNSFFFGFGGMDVLPGASVRLEHVVISGGSFANISARAPIVLRNSVIRDSLGWGLLHEAADTTDYLDTNTFDNNPAGDIATFDGI